MVAELDKNGVMKESAEERQKRLEPLIALRMKKRDEWNAFWKIWEIETRGRPFSRLRYYIWRSVDIPATFWREKIIEPLQDKYGHSPYYHRRFKRVATIDDCHVNDMVCKHEAQMQFRLDKQVDNKILAILRNRCEECMRVYSGDVTKCAKESDDYEEAELNWYIKYGEIGWYGDVVTCYMKQKHRLIWERRNPEIMAERQKAYEEYKRQLNLGIYDHWFWKRGSHYMYTDYRRSELRLENVHPYTLKIKDSDVVSLDPEYYRQRQEDEKAGKVKLAKPWEVFP